MSFRRTDEAVEYFRHIEEDSRIKFDIIDTYLLSAYLGMFLLEVSSKERKYFKEFIKGFPKKINSDMKSQVVTLLINTEVKKNALDLSNRNHLKLISNKLLDSDTKTFLSTDGHEILDRYSQRGVEKLVSEEIENRDAIEFLLQYKELSKRLSESFIDRYNSGNGVY